MYERPMPRWQQLTADAPQQAKMPAQALWTSHTCPEYVCTMPDQPYSGLPGVLSRAFAAGHLQQTLAAQAFITGQPSDRVHTSQRPALVLGMATGAARLGAVQPGCPLINKQGNASDKQLGDFQQ